MRSFFCERKFAMACSALFYLAFLAMGAGGAVAAGPQETAVPKITFELFWEPATPQKYTISVDQAGNAHYESHTPSRPAEGRTPVDSEPDDFEMEIALSAEARDQIFQSARELGYFNGDWAFRKHSIASTGRKSLSYTDGEKKFRTEYDFSENKSLQKLTSVFQGISLTIEHGRKLQFLLRFDKLGLDAELKGMEAMAKNGDLYELQLIEATLKKIAGDSRVLHMARERAARLLAGVGKN